MRFTEKREGIATTEAERKRVNEILSALLQEYETLHQLIRAELENPRTVTAPGRVEGIQRKLSGQWSDWNLKPLLLLGWRSGRESRTAFAFECAVPRLCSPIRQLWPG